MVKYVCKIEFVDLFVGKVPSNPEALVHVVRKRVKEGVLPAETNVEAEALREAYEVLQRAEMVNTFYSDEKGLYIKLSILLCYYSINYEKSFINEIVTFNSFMLLLTLDTNVWSMDSGNLSILLCYYLHRVSAEKH